MILKKAVKRLCKELKKDKHYFYAWQSNIAMAFKDECQRTDPQEFCEERAKWLHKAANKAAKNFLNHLIKS